MTRRSRAGVTLIEMMIVVAIIGLMAGLTFPAISSGIESLRLNEASNELVSLLNQALTRAERHEQVIEIVISKSARTFSLQTPQPGFEKKYELPRGVSIVRVLPETDKEPDALRQFLIYPGGAVPGIGVELSNARGDRRLVQVDPITGVPRVEAVTEAP